MMHFEDQRTFNTSEFWFLFQIVIIIDSFIYWLEKLLDFTRYFDVFFRPNTYAGSKYKTFK